LCVKSRLSHRYALDLSNTDAVTALADQVGWVDILVNNAGAIPSGPIEDISLEGWRRGWDLKVWGYIALTKIYWARMKERRQGPNKNTTLNPLKKKAREPFNTPTRHPGVILNDIGNSCERTDYNYVAGSSGNASLVAFTRCLGGVSMDHGVRCVA